MQKPIDKLVLIAVALFAVSLAIRAYDEASTLIALAELGQNLAYQLGRGVIPFAYYLFQVFVLWKLLAARNWARIVLAIIVLINGLLLMAFLSGPATVLGLSPIVPALQLGMEVVAVALLFSSSAFRVEDARAA